MVKRIIFSLLFLLLLGGCSEPPYTNIDATRLKALMAEGVPIYDIRHPEEWKQTGIIKNSRLLTFLEKNGSPAADFLPRFTKETNKHSPVILICRTGNRTSLLATHLMLEMGYTTVYNVKNGITGWIKEKNPTQPY